MTSTFEDIKGTVLCAVCMSSCTRGEVRNTTFAGWEIVSGNTGALSEKRACGLCKAKKFVYPMILLRRAELEMA